MALIDVTTAARVKATLEGISGSTLDTVIAQFITSVSAEFERYLRRGLKAEARTDTRRHRQWASVFALDAYPVSAVSSLKYVSHPSLATGATTMAAEAYWTDPATGLVQFLQEMSLEPGFIAAAYTGGMAADTAGLIAAYPDIAQAADWQVAYELTRRRSPGGNVTMGGGGTSYGEAEVQLLVKVKASLDRYRRHWV